MFIIYAFVLLLPTVVPLSLSDILLRLKNNTSGIQAALENHLEQVFPNGNTLESLDESVNALVLKIDDIINHINENSAAYIENLEYGKTSQILHLLTTPCVDDYEFYKLKNAYQIELGILEASIRDAIMELKDKVLKMKLTFDIEETVLQVKLASCKILNATDCANETIHQNFCFNDSSLPDQQVLSVDFFRGKSEVDQVSLIPSVVSRESPYQLMPTECDDGKFKCSNGQCIVFSYACDGETDCSDGSDEYPGCQRGCSGKRCRNLHCIRDDQVCNGVDDCGDRSDEEDCVTYIAENCNLTNEQFLCSDKKRCLPLRQMCNGVPHCDDGSDETIHCNQTEGCTHCAAIGGSCLRTPNGPVCLRKCPSSLAFDLETGQCDNSQTDSSSYIVYRASSFMEIFNKIKFLTLRFSNGFLLLKKHLNNMLHDSVNKCISENGIGLNRPFLLTSKN